MKSAHSGLITRFLNYEQPLRGMKYLLDTNIVIHLFRGKRSLSRKMDEVGLSNCSICELTKAELLLGEEIAARRGISVNRAPLRDFFQTVEILPISLGIELFSLQKARLMSEGRIIEDFDLLIGCCAIACGRIMVSENTGHLSRIEGIRLENWLESGR